MCVCVCVCARGNENINYLLSCMKVTSVHYVCAAWQCFGYGGWKENGSFMCVRCRYPHRAHLNMRRHICICIRILFSRTFFALVCWQTIVSRVYLLAVLSRPFTAHSFAAISDKLIFGPSSVALSTIARETTSKLFPFIDGHSYNFPFPPPFLFAILSPPTSPLLAPQLRCYQLSELYDYNAYCDTIDQHIGQSGRTICTSC